MSSGVLAAAMRGKPIGLRVRKTLWRAIVYLLLLILVAVALLPLLWMVSTSLKPGYLEAYSLSLLPSKVTWSNYPDTWNRVPFPRPMANTMFITALALFGSIVSASITGFAFARLRFPGRDVWFAILIMTMLIPPAIMIIPQYLLFNWLRWIDSYKPLIVPWFSAEARSGSSCSGSSSSRYRRSSTRPRRSTAAPLSASSPRSSCR